MWLPLGDFMEHRLHFLKHLCLVHEYLSVPAWLGAALGAKSGSLQSLLVLLQLGIHSLLPCVLKLDIPVEFIVLPHLIVSWNIELELSQVNALLFIIDFIQGGEEYLLRVD